MARAAERDQWPELRSGTSGPSCGARPVARAEERDQWPKLQERDQWPELQERD